MSLSLREKRNPYVKIISNENIEYIYDGNYPDIFKQLDIKNVFYLPIQKMIFDTYLVLDQNKKKLLELHGYQVFIEDDFTLFKNLIKQHVSHR